MSTRTRIAWLGAVVLATLALEDVALARVGGGQSFSSGGGGGGFHGGGGGGGGDIIFLLIRLVFVYPQVGVPLLLIVGGVMLYNKLHGGDRATVQTHRTHQRPPRRGPTGIAGLKQRDANFSEPLFIDFIQLVYARGHQLRPAADTGPLAPYFTDKALATLRADREGLEEVKDVIFGASRIVGVELTAQWSNITVLFETNLTEVRHTPQQLHLQERWTFRRRAAALSPGPDGMRVLSCPSCGSTSEPRSDGTCPHCDAVRTGGTLQWEVSRIVPVLRRKLTAPETQLGGGVEPGTRRPTVVHPDLPARRRAFTARHPDHDWAAFQQRTSHVFIELQRAWSSQRWELARPYETDALFQVHRFWIERYKRFKLANRLDQVQIQRMELANIDVDAFFESVTVRIWASMLDWTETADGKIVGGSKKQRREFSEYWTFIRTAGRPQPDPAKGDAAHCPSCGAPLDNVSMAGVCGYCDSKITSGDYDWVLSRIEQDDVYG